jgi:hypothetical protein
MDDTAPIFISYRRSDAGGHGAVMDCLVGSGPRQKKAELP